MAQQLSSPKLTVSVISSHQHINEPLNLGCPSSAVLSRGRKTRAEGVYLLTPFRLTDCHHTVKDPCLRYYTDLVQGPQTLALHHRVGHSRLYFLPLLYAEQTQFAQQECLCKCSILHINSVVWGFLCASTAEYMNYRSVKFSVCFGLL